MVNSTSAAKSTTANGKEVLRPRAQIATSAKPEDEAMDFIDESGDKPCFCYLATYSPHTPLDAPEEFIAPFRDDVNEKHATYLGMVANIDYNVGRITEFLKDRGLEDDTIIVFMNDNGQTEGLDVYNAGMRGCKCTAWEGGTRAMTFWKWPGHGQPHTVENLTAHLDVLPTPYELAGVDIPDKLQVGRWPSGLAVSHKHAMCRVRQGNCQLLRSMPCDDPECKNFRANARRCGRYGKD